MPAAYTHKLSVQVSDFEDIGLLIQLARLICDFCSSSQRFACGFLQIPPRDGHPCRPANDSPCRVRRRLSLPSERALPGATKKGRCVRNVLLTTDSIGQHLLSHKRNLTVEVSHRHRRAPVANIARDSSSILRLEVVVPKIIQCNPSRR